ncbi:MAG: hypothetical protein DSY89_00265 [Deltaproteobacteria bacterium]|nr:MAG: hypothetical protein DSY89_00265 [Deltaproteobacteria bacterium]
MPRFQDNTRITRRHLVRTLGYTLLINTFIAAFLTLIGFSGGRFWNIFLFSQCIGLSICTGTLIVSRFFTVSGPLVQALTYFGGIFIGAMGGTLLGSLLSGIPRLSFFEDYKTLGQVLYLGLVFGSIIAYFFTTRERLTEVNAQLQEERIKRIIGEKAAIEADLKRLQAQVEPHFLFNTLSNILSLIDTDPAAGKTMLENLTGYLRISLDRTRRKAGTIGQEIAMIRNYMDIYKTRMGNRFRYRIDVAGEISDLPFPPMLIQPLVENAIRHGLEPKIKGGEIRIAVAASEKSIRFNVSDTGTGMPASTGSGVGLANIKNRLVALYGDRGKLTLQENHPTGFTAIIEVPHAADSRHHRR